MIKRNVHHLVEGKYVHKKKAENILLSNLRRALPTHIPRSIWEREISGNESFLSKDELKMLRSYYILHSENIGVCSAENTPEKIEGDYYVLLNVPHFLEPNLFDGKNYFTSKEIQELSKFYTFHDRRKCYVINKSVRDIEEVQILKILQRKDICMSEAEKYQLANVLEKLPGIPKENIYYANMVIDLKHPFFFEHPTEHLPGMMVLEAARQLIVCVSHVYGRVPHIDFSMILDLFTADFKNYIELHHPVKLKGVITKLETGKDSVWRKMTMEILVLQMDAITGVLTIGGQGISKKLFTKLRRTLPKENNKTRYYPIASFQNRIAIRRDETDENLSCTLINISLSGFCIELHQPILVKEGIPIFDFVFCFETMGFIFGKGRIVWQFGEDTKYFAGIEIVNISLQNKDSLYEAIKRYCYVIEEREIL